VACSIEYSLYTFAGLTINGRTMDAIIEGANRDVRQVLNNLQMWCSVSKTLAYDEAEDRVIIITSVDSVLTCC
jgi:hypothetical protein